jgi:hypothetical protein
MPPSYLYAGIPPHLQNHNDPVSDAWERPALPENFVQMEEHERAQAKSLYVRRLVHYYYLGTTEMFNEPLFHAMTYPLSYTHSRLFIYASRPWVGETLDLKLALIDATEKWESFAGKGVPCPIAFDAEDVRKMKELGEVQEKADKIIKETEDFIGVDSEGWVHADRYEEVMALFKRLKEEAETAAKTEEDREEMIEIKEH